MGPPCRRGCAPPRRSRRPGVGPLRRGPRTARPAPAYPSTRDHRRRADRRRDRREPSSTTSIATSVGRYRTATQTRDASACLRTLVRASCTMRNAARSAPAGNATRSPSTRTFTGSPEATVSATKVSRSPIPGLGTSSGWLVSSRNTLRSRRISPNAVRLIASMATSDSLAASGERSSTMRPVPACTAITLIEWATTSWSSRAMRSRSEMTAWRANCSRVRASSAARSRSAAAASIARRLPSPTSQAVSNTATLATTVAGPEPVSATATAIAKVVTASRTAARRRGQRAATVYTAITIAGPSPTATKPRDTYTRPVTTMATSTASGHRRRTAKGATWRTTSTDPTTRSTGSSTVPTTRLTLNRANAAASRASNTATL